tara:strand:+ start:948 stop:2399 length:1452 start_codon:yes stop_codon:yes gene_type:complete
MNMKTSYYRWSQRGVFTNYDETICKRIGNQRGRWGSSRQSGKTMSATTAAIISTLHAAGPDLTLRAKDMVNDATRRGYAHDTGKMGQYQRPLRGQTSCGEDEYDGALLSLYSLQIPDNMESLSNKYSWHIAVDEQGNTKEPKAIRLGKLEYREAHTKGNILGAEHVQEYVAELKSEYMTDTDWSDKTLGETTTRDERLDWMLQNYSDSEWYGKLQYRAQSISTVYKGECAWAGEGRCLHHDGVISENVIQYTLCNYPMAYNPNRERLYLDEYEGDESELLKSLVDDEDVLVHIKKQIPKMKTESRYWLDSSGTRGHYTLTWWRYIQNEMNKQLKHEADLAQLEQDKARDGFEINGWKFVLGNSKYSNVSPSMWYAIEPLYNYEVGAFVFRSKSAAEDFIKRTNGFRHMMVGRQMNKGGAVIDHLLTIKKSRVPNLSLSRDADPTLLTPEQVVSTCYTNGTFPEDYPFSPTSICRFIEAEPKEE